MAVDGKKIEETVNDIAQPIVDFAQHWASFFGFDLKKLYKKFTGRENEDLTTMISAINKAFEGKEVKISQKQDKIQKALDNLIGLAKTPNIRNKISALQSKLVSQNRDVMADAAATQVEKIRLNNLASDIDNATFGELAGSRIGEKMRELQKGIDQAAGTAQPKVSKVLDSKSDLNKVEERL